MDYYKSVSLHAAFPASPASAHITHGRRSEMKQRKKTQQDGFQARVSCPPEGHFSLLYFWVHFKACTFLLIPDLTSSISISTFTRALFYTSIWTSAWVKECVLCVLCCQTRDDCHILTNVEVRCQDFNTCEDVTTKYIQNEISAQFQLVSVSTWSFSDPNRLFFVSTPTQSPSTALSPHKIQTWKYSK